MGLGDRGWIVRGWLAGNSWIRRAGCVWISSIDEELGKGSEGSGDGDGDDEVSVDGIAVCGLRDYVVF